MESRIMFLIFLLLALWIILSPTGRSYIANLSEAIVSGVNGNKQAQGDGGSFEPEGFEQLRI